jgi:hypothetical protein
VVELDVVLLELVVVAPLLVGMVELAVTTV